MTALLELKNITKNFSRPLDVAARIARLAGANVHQTVVHALDDVSLTIAEGEVVGLAGESGCGKSTLGRIAAGILTPTAGTRAWRGTDVALLAPDARRQAALKGIDGVSGCGTLRSIRACAWPISSARRRTCTA